MTQTEGLRAMSSDIYITILGGDKREIVLGEALKGEGFRVRFAGFEKYPGGGLTGEGALAEAKLADGKLAQGTLAEKKLAQDKLAKTLAGSRVVILPLSGVDENGVFRAPYACPGLSLSPRLLSRMEKGTLLLVGSLPSRIRAGLKEQGVRALETAERHDLACLNAVPTAEGTLQYAMRESDILLQGSSSLVTGFGRCAKALAFRLQALGSRVTIGARKSWALAEAEMYGYRGIPLARLAGSLPEYHFIFNTVPAMIFDEALLKKAAPGAVVIDIASRPGGVDMKAARELGLSALNIPGIPGKAVPVSAGRILARVYIPLIRRYLEGELLEKGGEEDEA